MPKLSVERSIRIGAPVGEVYARVRDFRSWPEWSPWLVCEPDCPLLFSPDGDSYSWDGEVIGEGSITVVAEDEGSRIDYDLRFLRPHRSRADVSMHFEPDGEGTIVRWTLDSSLPIFLFWMKSSMAAFLGMDYERGLAMLRDLLESGSVPSCLEFGTTRHEPGTFIGIRTRCDIPEIGPTMERDIETMEEWLTAKQVETVGVLRSFYHKWDPVLGVVDYSIGYLAERAPEGVAPGMVRIELPALETYMVRHTGTYEHLGNAWSAGIMHGRAKRFRQRRGIHPFETYEKRPAAPGDRNTVTVVQFPVK